MKNGGGTKRNREWDRDVKDTKRRIIWSIDGKRF